jgi:hypothetical protein
VDREFLTRVMKHNCFGPDFKVWSHIEREWRETKSIGNFRRLYGLYVVPALINHSCVANACRVFIGDTMFVRATQDLGEGEEVVWPYTMPFQSFVDRQQHLQGVFGFKCACARCVAECDMPTTYFDLSDRVAEVHAKGASLEDVRHEHEALVGEIEKQLEGAKDAQIRRWCRASFLNVYFNYFNSFGRSQDPAVMKRVAKLENDLHWSLLCVNNVSCEHLSLMHVCYETSTYTDGVDSKLSRFWFEQLKRAHLTRYGPLDLESLREMLKHTRLVLRNLDGWRRTTWHFL